MKASKGESKAHLSQQRRAFETDEPGNLILWLPSETHPSPGDTGAAVLLRDPELSAVRSA